MKTLVQRSLMSVALAIATCSAAQAGRDGGGGQGVVCRDPKTQQVISVELLDIWEARTIQKRPVIQTEASIKDIVRFGFNEIAKGVFLRQKTFPASELKSKDDAASMMFEALYINYKGYGSMDALLSPPPYKDNRRVKYFSNVKFKLSEDAEELAQGPDPSTNCAIEQLAIYKDRWSKLFINADLVAKMDNVNKAGFILHEQVYKQLREEGDVSSLRTRRLVGLVLTGVKLLDYDELLAKFSSYTTCADHHDIPKTLFYVIKQPTGYAVLPRKLEGLSLTQIDANRSQPTIDLRRSVFYANSGFTAPLTDFAGVIHLDYRKDSASVGSNNDSNDLDQEYHVDISIAKDHKTHKIVSGMARINRSEFRKELTGWDREFTEVTCVETVKKK